MARENVRRTEQKLGPIKKGDEVEVRGRVVCFQTEPLEVGESKPLTRVLVEFTKLRSIPP